VSDLFEPIAVVGIAGRLPGAWDVREFWRNLVSGRECLTGLTDEELLAAGVPRALIDDPAYVKSAGLIPGVDMFDPEFFGMTPREAEICDPQLRLFLEVTYSAIEDAGYDPTQMTRDVAVYGACGPSRYSELHVRANPEYSGASGTGLMVLNNIDYLATLTSYKLNLRGPSMAVLTACSSSLTAVHLACRSLQLGECDAAVAGASNVDLPYGTGYRWSPGDMRSADGHCRPFDTSGSGTVFTNGAGAVLLKRLSDAIEDADHIWGVIHGIGINNDGSDKVSFGAPSVSGQSAAVVDAMATAEFAPESIGYVEMSATGTPLGDPIEMSALAGAYRRLAERPLLTGRIPVGSVKGNIGHTVAVAGIAGLLKLVLALEHEQLPPTVNVSRPNPKLELETSPFFLNGELRAWPRTPAGPRRAGLSSLGIGGTNVHLVVQEGPDTVRTPHLQRPRVVVWSGRDEDAAYANRSELAAYFAVAGEPSFAGATATLQRGRTAHPVRGAVVCASAEEAAGALGTGNRLLAGSATEQPPGVVFAFPGQGSPYARMAVGLYGRQRVFTETVDECLDDLSRHGLDLYPLWLAADPGESLDGTANAEALLFAVEYALARQWTEWGVVPAAVLGHGVGELVAATVAGVMRPADALRLVAVRGRTIGRLPRGGTPPAVDEVRTCLDGMRLCAPEPEVYSAATGKRLTGDEAVDPAFWTRQLTAPMLIAQALDELDVDAGRAGRRVVLEVGPGSELTELVRRHPAVRDGRWWALPSLPRPDDGAEARSEERDVLEVLAELWVTGCPVDWATLYRDERPDRISLPGYRFQRRRFWVTPVTGPAAPRTDAAGRPAAQAEPGVASVASPTEAEDTGPFTVPGWAESAHPAPPTGGGAGQDTTVLLLVPASRAAELPVVAALEQLGHRVCRLSPGTEFAERDGEFTVRIGCLGEDLQRVTRRLKAIGRLPSMLVHASGCGDPTAAGGASDELDRTFLALYDLVRRAERVPDAGRLPSLVVLTSGAVDVSGGEPVVPARAALVAAVRTYVIASPELACRVIDTGAVPRRDRLAAELGGGATDAVVALRGTRRWLPVDRAWTPPSADGPAIRPNGVYVLSGDPGRLAWAVAKGLTATGQRPALAFLTPGSPDVTEDIAEIESMGGRVRIIACDPGDREQLRKALDETAAAFGQVNGVLHFVGATDDGVSPGVCEDVHRVLRSTVHGADALDSVLADRPPVDFVVCLSGGAVLPGEVGSADEAAARAFLAALAADRPGWLSIGWPGPTTDATATDATGAGATPDTQTPDTSPPSDGPYHETVLSAATHWALDEHRLGGTAVLPGAGVIDLVLSAYLNTVPGATAPVTLRDVVFLHPLAGEAPRRTRVNFEPAGEGAWRVRVLSRTEGTAEAWKEHVKALLGPGAPSPHALHDEQSATGFTDIAPSSMRTGLGGAFVLGPRWHSVERIRESAGTTVVSLALPRALAAEAQDHAVHPALLDAGTAVPRRNPSGEPLVPSTYGSMTWYGPLPHRVDSWVRTRPGDELVLDAEFVDADGSVLVAIEGLRTRPAGQTPSGAEPESVAEDGPATGEAVRLLLRLLAAPTPGEIAVVPPRESRPAASASVSPAAAAAGSVEDRLADLWRQILGRAHIAAGDDFFELGGDSLMAMTLTGRIRDTFGVRLTVPALFDYPILAALAAELRAQGAR
jgi:phthiocerol/phenolphthiocerol synthesis type-I polyketide synthase E